MGKRILRRIYNEGYDKDRATETNGCFIKIGSDWLLDTCMGCGTHIFGHPKTHIFSGSSLYAFPNKLAATCAELLFETTGFNHFIFANSGTEATMKAIRLARAYTERDKIAFMENAWHGSQDYALVPYSRGIPQAVKDLVIILPFSDEAFKIIEREKPALVMIEPLQGSLPIDRKEFIEKLRYITAINGTLLCFDEIITGFRMALGGMVECYGIRPDLATYGKIIGGGYPIGIIAGNDVVKEAEDNVFMGGTFSANPLTIRGSIDILNRLKKESPYKKLYGLIDILKGINTAKLEVVANRAIAKVITKEDITKKLMKKGIFLNKNRMILPSTLHTDGHSRYCL